MVRSFTLPTRRAALVGAVGFAILLLAAGCGSKGGPSDYEKMVQAKQGASDALAAAGAKVQEKQYPVGRGYVVELRGATITDDLLRHVKELGNIAELNLSQSTLTDDHLRTMHELGLHVLLNKLDLSHTAVTDAGLDHLDGNLFLVELNLTGTKVTRAAVERFKQKRQADARVRVKDTRVIL
ncbi:MAG TPA: hypothetical protein VKE74_17120 [Gemmataceae bacterium]|nr:hypothetical protein [Gemmataceae bacterium]